MAPILRHVLTWLLPLSLGLGGTVQAEPPAAPAPVLKPALWKVSDADTTIYLFGTIHALPEGMVWLQGPVAEAFDRSDTLVTELPDLDATQVSAAVLSLAPLPKGQTLRGLLPRKERRALENELRASKLDPAQFDAVKPWFAAISLLVMKLKSAGFGKESGVEIALDARAKAQNKPRIGLETMAQQLAQFDALSLKDQRALLQAVIKAHDGGARDLSGLVKEWGEGDATRLARLLKEDDRDPLSKPLIADRNRNWAGWIGTRLDQPGTVFVAVGAGHLAGKGSVQDDLAQAGIQTTRVQ